MPNIETLHAHTTQSDGKLNHHKLLETAHENQVSTLAFTDHDALMPLEIYQKLSRTPLNIQWISGIEISSSLPIELSGKPHSGLHIVGLFVDPNNSNLKHHTRLAQEARISRMQKIIQNLNSLGFKITEADCLRMSVGESVGRPHIVQALNLFPQNIERIEELRIEMAKEAEKSESIRLRYETMMSQGKHQYPYVLFLSEDSYIPRVYVDYEYAPTLDESALLIRNAGGVAVIAHYSTIIRAIPISKLESLILEQRIDGIETVFGLWDLTTPLRDEIFEIRSELRSLALRTRCIISGGADVHSAQDLQDFSAHKDYSNETRGMTEKIIKTNRVDTRWSSYSL